MSRQEIDKANTQFLIAVNSGDFSKAMDVYNETSKLMPPNAPTAIGKANIQAFTEGFFKVMGVTNFKLETSELEFIENIAIEHGVYSFKHHGGEDIGKYVVVWKRDELNSWKMHLDIFNSNQMPAT